MNLLNKMIFYAGMIVIGYSAAANADFATATLTAGTNPGATAVNPVTNKTYVANFGSGTVTVINGATNSTASVAVGTNPQALAVNLVTNKIYVANGGSGNVTVIDGATNATATVSAGTDPYAIAVNPVTNKIYVANAVSNNVTVIDGATNSTASVSVGTDPGSITVNPVTNKIYVANYASNNVTVINGATNGTTSVATGTYPNAVAVNPVTNKIYVSNYGSANVTVIDGATNATSAVTVGSSPVSVAVNPVTNKIYVANRVSNSVTVIDGATNSTTPVTVGTYPCALAVNPVTNKIYVPNNSSGNVTVIDGSNNSTSTVTVGTTPKAVAVNPVTNKIYVANYGSGNVTVIDGSSNSTATVGAGTSPYAVAMNPLTNKIYVANYGSGNVMVIDGATNSTAPVSVGTNPDAIAVNPVTNKIYVANYGSSNVTVIDGLSNSTIAVSAGSNPNALALNPVTNKIYVTNSGSNNVTVIDGATNSTVTVSVGSNPQAIMVNPATNKIYVTNYGSSNVTVIDGATNSTAPAVTVGTNPDAIAVNPVTNKIYVANYGSTNVTVIDGATNLTTPVTVGTNPDAIAVNPVTNKIYVANYGSTNVTVIDGATNSTATVSVGTNPDAIAVNPVTSKIYVANNGSTNVTVIDGATNSTATVSAGTSPRAIAVNPVTDKIYVANYGSANVTVLTDAPANVTNVRAIADSLPLNSAFASKPLLSGYAVNKAFTGQCGIQGAFSRLNTAQSSWNPVTTTSFAGTDSTRWTSTWGTTDSLIPGENFLCTFAADSQCATINSLGLGAAFTGNVTVYPIYYLSVIPLLSLPTNGTCKMVTSPTLSWNVAQAASPYSIQVSTVSSFSSTVFFQNALTTASTIASSGLSTGTLYYWQVNATGTSGPGGWSNVWSFATALNPPVPALPTNSAVNQSFTPLLTWDQQSGATSYALQVSTVSDFSSTVSSQTGLPSNSQTVGPLVNLTMYYWQVNAANAGDTSGWSSMGIFTTTVAAPVLASPTSAAAQQTITPLLTWNSVTGATSYGLMVSTASNFSSTVFSQTGLTDISQTMDPLSDGSLYYWQVNASNADGTGGWSGAWSFATVLDPPVLGLPTNNAVNQPLPPLLTWNLQPGANSYALQVSTVSDFSSTVYLQTGLTSNSQAVGSLLNLTMYYWQVNAANTGDASGWSNIGSFTTVPTTCNVPIAKGWNIISLNVVPFDSSASAIFGNPASMLNQHYPKGFILVKSVSGDNYMPTLGINSLTVVNTGAGYQVYSDSTDTIRTQGTMVNIATTPVSLQGPQWNLLGYLPQSSMPIATALNGVVSSIVLVKNNSGFVYWPGYHINTIGTMNAGQGYYIFMNAPASLTYPPPGKQLTNSDNLLKLPDPRHYGNHDNTGSNATMLAAKVTLGSTLAPDSCEIGAFDEKGNLIGAGGVVHGLAAFAIWGDNPQTKGKDGAASSEKISFKLWDGVQDYPLDFASSNGSEARYSDNAILLGSLSVPPGALIKKFDLSKAYPNPFRGSLHIAFDVPMLNGIAEQKVSLAVYDLRGRMIEQIAKGLYKAGHYTVQWNSEADKSAVTGSNIYIVRMQADNFDKRLKVIKLKN